MTTDNAPQHPGRFATAAGAGQDRAARRRAGVADGLLRRAAAAPEEARGPLRDAAVQACLPLAESVARRYRVSRVDLHDLRQVARLGLVLAARRYDGAKGDFVPYAVATMAGEIKRFLRDRCWAVRPPRRVQDLQSAIPVASGELAQDLGRDPRPHELAARLSAEPAEVDEALSAVGCFTPASIDAPAPGQSADGAALAQTLGEADPGMDRTELVVSVADRVRHLPQRDQRILFLRFFCQRSQREIAAELGTTQMQVSRRLDRVLATLRTELGAA